MILTFYCMALAAGAGLLVWCAAARWWHYAVIAVACVPLFPLIAHSLTGDISRWLPEAAFSAGAAGKDEIVLASAYSTIVLAVAFAAAIFWAIRIGWQRAPPR
jgi:hypothetical protein